MSQKLTTIITEPRKSIITKSSWPKKELADVHLEALLFCQFGCKYCSSNAGLHLRFKKRTLDKAVRDVTGQGFDPHNSGHIVIAYDHFVEELEMQLDKKKKKPGAGKVLVYSQLTDGFSPVLLGTGTTRRILEILIEKTNYRIRILTKNAVVGNRQWTKFFADHADRFVVGLSIGTLDAEFARRMECGTSRPESRVAALRRLQDAGVPTYGMLCPVFPSILESDELERLIEGIRPDQCERVWTEPYNERTNWEPVRGCLEKGSPLWTWMTRVFEQRETALWSQYATELYTRIHAKAVADGWSDKLRYLLYEGDITAQDSLSFGDLDGVLLQSAPDQTGKSRNPAIAALQLGAITKG